MEPVGVARSTELVKTVDEQGNKVYNGKYVLGRKIASNTLCTIREATLVGQPGQRVTLKIWKKQVLRSKKEYHKRPGGHGMIAVDQLMKVMGSEVKAMLALANDRNPNVVQLLEIIDDQGFEDKLVLAMEFCPGGQLLTWDVATHTFRANQVSEQVDAEGRVQEASIRLLIKQVANGLKFCHEHGVIHRDIKPQNIMFGADGQAKIIDFGVSHILEDPAASDLVKQTEGTYHFMPPEACDPDISTYSGRAADVWALGVTVYALLFNKCPFLAATEFELMETIRQHQAIEFPPSSERAVSPELMQLLQAMLTKDCDQRITVDGILAHPWLA